MRLDRDTVQLSRNRLVKILYVVSATLIAVVLLCVIGAGYLMHLASRLPDLRANPDAIKVPETSIVYAADGSVLAQWNDGQDRTVVPNDQIPEYLKQAAVAIEDKRFYQHGGVDMQAIVRALSVNSKAGQVRQGGSTITQQTVKLLYTDGKRTVTRKIEEALLALSLETRADKDDVLGVYLNTVYFGSGAYGVESASRRFFGTTTKDLSLAQSALLAGCIQSPTRYDPFANPGTALRRRNTVIHAMEDQGFITTEQASHAAAEPLGVKIGATAKKQFAPFFVEYVRRDLLARLGSKRLYQGGLRIYTTLQPAAQRAAEAAARTVLPATTDPEVAIASVNWRDGSVVAVVGGRDFGKGQFDLATQGRRQTGSAFKPFVLAAALEKGYSLSSKWDASPYSTPVKDGIWHVENYENAITGGQYTLEIATVWSINTVYARLITSVGPENVVAVAHRMGITAPLDPDPAIALGGLKTGVSPLEMASAFGTIANGGLAVKPSGVLKVTDDKGRVVYSPDRAGTRAIPEGVAKTLGSVLNEVYSRGTGSGANFGRWGAVKTGTAQSWQDAWIVGYSGDLSTAVWVGYPKAQVPMQNVHGIKVTGGSFPAQVWKGYMQVASVPATGSASVTTTEQPGQSGTTYQVYKVCSESFKLARPDCPNPTDMVFPTGTFNPGYCTLRH